MGQNKFKGMRAQRTIHLYYGIKWIAENVDNPEEIMVGTFKKDKLQGLKVAEVIRKHIPTITNEILNGQRDIKIVDNGKLILATHPRPHQEWAYDFLKSYICVTGPIRKEQEILKKFENEKRNAKKRKRKLQFYINKIKPTLNTLVKEGLVDGILGRGSFFGSNSYPIDRDDIDFILLVNELKKGAEEEIVKILKQIPMYSVTLVRRNDDVIKKGKSREISFVIVTRRMVLQGLGIEYERYVLRDGIGIKLEEISADKSKKLANEFISLLPKKPSKRPHIKIAAKK